MSRPTTYARQTGSARARSSSTSQAISSTARVTTPSSATPTNPTTRALTEHSHGSQPPVSQVKSRNGTRQGLDRRRRTNPTLHARPRNTTQAALAQIRVIRVPPRPITTRRSPSSGARSLPRSDGQQQPEHAPPQPRDLVPEGFGLRVAGAIMVSSLVSFVYVRLVHRHS